jgi:hypothetical protein
MAELAYARDLEINLSTIAEMLYVNGVKVGEPPQIIGGNAEPSRDNTPEGVEA